MYDVIIVGGGVSGMSAGLILGRCRRSVLICDNNQPRNARSKALHGYLTRDGIPPLEFRRIAREQLKAYANIEVNDVEICDATYTEDGFEVLGEDGSRFCSKFLVIASGITDVLPQLEGIEDMYGTSVFHCPYCDGWENRDKPFAVYGRIDEAIEFALELKTWSSDIVLCTDGDELSDTQKLMLSTHGIGLQQDPIQRLEGRDGQLEKIVFASGEELMRSVLFVGPRQFQKSALAEKFDLEQEGAGVKTGKLQEVRQGLYVIGDAVKSVQLAIVAAAEGAEAAFSINTALQKIEQSIPA